MIFFLGGAMTLAAGGDLCIVLKLLKYKTSKKEILCLDHPTEVGLIALEK